MTGPEHYRLAETFAAQAEEAFERGHVNSTAMLNQLAQVHATLALTAATAAAGRPQDDGERPGMSYTDFNAWSEVIG